MPTTPALDRALAKVSYDRGCGVFHGVRARGGYGMIRPNSRDNHKPAHRVVYEAIVGPIPDDMDLDHLCRNPACVNPDHLEPVTAKENTRRGTVANVTASRNRTTAASMTHCKRGHAFTGDNVLHMHGQRRCRACFEAYRAKVNRRRLVN